MLGLFSGGTHRDALRDLNAIARDTGAVRASGEPIVFDIGARGERLDTGVIDAIDALVGEVPIDIDLVTEDVGGDEFDATRFVRGIETVRAVPADGATDRGDHFERVFSGTRVTFRVLLENDRFPRGPEPIIVLLRVVFRGDGATRLHTTLVRILIPSVRDETYEDSVTTGQSVLRAASKVSRSRMLHEARYWRAAHRDRRARAAHRRGRLRRRYRASPLGGPEAS